MYRVHPVFAFLVALAMIAAAAVGHAADVTETGSVIFIHPDGASLSGWLALRLVEHGPDGLTNWDRLDRMGAYTGHLRDSAVSSSNGGATVHAWGVKADFADYGSHPDRPLQSLSGKTHGIMIEAREAGRSVGIINSGHMAEPGTGVFVSNVRARRMADEIASQVVESGADVIMSGGEVLLLPAGVKGVHGAAGIRQDGLNLIDRAKELGYTVVWTRQELLALTDDVDKVLGVFAAGQSFNAISEEQLRERDLPLYVETAPTVGEMTEVALRILKRKGKEFLLVVEEEGTDNFANNNNARGTLEALRRADAAIGVAMRFIDANPKTLLVTAADSDAGGLQVVRVEESLDVDRPLPATSRNGAPLDGVDGPESAPFMTAPDRDGRRMPFAIAWAGYEDFAGGIVARAHGLNAHLLPKNVDNTDIYRMMYATLFGRWLP